MLTRLEVHHVISDDVTNVHNFSLLFGIREIPSELGLKVKAPLSSLRVFATLEEAANEAYWPIDWITFVPYSKAKNGKLRSYRKRVVFRSRKVLRWSYFSCA
jgi:hypothetical protein